MALPRTGDMVIKRPDVQTFLDSNKLALSGLIGTGSFSRVHRAIDCSGDVFAVKIFLSSTRKKYDKYIRSEIAILRKLKHVKFCH